MESLVTLEVVERVRAGQVRTLEALQRVRSCLELGSPEAVGKALEMLDTQLSSTLDLMSAVLDALTPDERLARRGR
jgi:hypothetical protein